MFIARFIYLGLEAGKQIDEERMPNRVDYFENALFGQQRFHFIPTDYIAFLQRFDSEIFPRVFILRQYYLMREKRKEIELIESALSFSIIYDVEKSC
jgi:hypothetical protein